MKEKVDVAAVQMDIAWLDPEQNLEKMINLVAKVHDEHKVDLIVFPELANTGFVKEKDLEFGKAYFKKAEKIPGPFTEALGAAARKYDVYIISGFCELHPEIPAGIYNSAVLMNPQGEIVGVHHKLHIPSEENHYFIPGSTTDIFKTDLGNIAMLVCYDAMFPELARILALKGAEIMCAVFNMPSRVVPADILSHVAASRSYENRVYFISCNRVGKEPCEFLGRSVITDPIAHILSRSGGGEEEIIYATFQLDRILEARALHPIFGDRRPELYGPITQRF